MPPPPPPLPPQISLGPEGLIPLEVRFLHDPWKAHGYVGAALSSNVIHIHKAKVIAGGVTCMAGLVPVVGSDGAGGAGGMAKPERPLMPPPSPPSPLRALRGWRGC